MDYIKISFTDNQENTEHDLIRTVEEMLNLPQHRFAFSRQRWRPNIDIYETSETIVVIAEIAGIQGEEIEVRIAPRSLKISGTRGIIPSQTSARYCLAEISSGYFERVVSLPAPVDLASAETIYSKGLLEIRLTKRPPDRIHKIEIKRN